MNSNFAYSSETRSLSDAILTRFGMTAIGLREFRVGAKLKRDTLMDLCTWML